MSVSSSSDAPDVLGTHPPETGRRPIGPVLLGVAVVAAAGAAVSVQARDAASPARVTPVELSGSIRFDEFTSRMVQLPFGDEQDRSGVGRGTVELELPDEQLRGDARIDFGASSKQADAVHGVFHAWGEVFLRLDTSSCRGSFGWSNFVEPLEGGGSMHLRCEDGALILARLVATRQPEDGMVIDVRDGWYVAGS